MRDLRDFKKAQRARRINLLIDIDDDDDRDDRDDDGCVKNSVMIEIEIEKTLYQRLLEQHQC